MGKLTKQYFCYVLLLLFFLIMCLSFTYRQDNIYIIIIFLFPVIYFLIKTIYGLILLLDSYKLYHHILIKEYNLLLIIGYNIIMLTLNDNNVIYYLQSIFIFLVSLYLKKAQKILVLISLIIGNIVFLLYMSSYFFFDLFYIILTFIMVNIFLVPLIYNDNEKIDKKIVAIDTKIDI